MDIKCIKCGSKSAYSREYDSYYCENCNIWLDSRCQDESCEYCSNRPETPFLIIIDAK